MPTKVKEFNKRHIFRNCGAYEPLIEGVDGAEVIDWQHGSVTYYGLQLCVPSMWSPNSGKFHMKIFLIDCDFSKINHPKKYAPAFSTGGPAFNEDGIPVDIDLGENGGVIPVYHFWIFVNTNRHQSYYKPAPGKNDLVKKLQKRHMHVSRFDIRAAYLKSKAEVLDRKDLHGWLRDMSLRTREVAKEVLLAREHYNKYDIDTDEYSGEPQHADHSEVLDLLCSFESIEGLLDITERHVRKVMNYKKHEFKIEHLDDFLYFINRKLSRFYFEEKWLEKFTVDKDLALGTTEKYLTTPNIDQPIRIQAKTLAREFLDTICNTQEIEIETIEQFDEIWKNPSQKAELFRKALTTHWSAYFNCDFEQDFVFDLTSKHFNGTV